MCVKPETNTLSITISPCSLSQVRDYVFEAIAAVLSSANIEYLKWDMNRPLTEVFSQVRPVKYPSQIKPR